MLIVKNVQRKNIETVFNAASAHTIHAKVKDMDATADYSRSANERVN